MDELTGQSVWVPEPSKPATPMLCGEQFAHVPITNHSTGLLLGWAPVASCKAQSLLDVTRPHRCAAGQVCVGGQPNPNNGVTNFDSLPFAMYNFFQVRRDRTPPPTTWQQQQQRAAERPEVSVAVGGGCPS